MLYSPLEQFEPIPLLTIFLGGVNFSITNVTIIFIYIVLVLCYFLNGYAFYDNDVKLIKLVHRKSGTLSVDASDQIDYLDFLYNKAETMEVVYFHKNKFICYIYCLFDNYCFSSEVTDIKKGWLGIDGGAAFHKSEHSRELHTLGYHNLLVSKNLTFREDYTFFNNIALFTTNFLNDIYLIGSSLDINFLKRNFNTSNILYTFSSKEDYMKSFIPNFNIYAFENVYNIILGMVKENIGGNTKRAVKFFPFVFTLFIFILLANLIGLIPYSSTVTSYLIVTFAMAVMVLVGVNIIAGRFHGLVYFGHFLPAGCPFALYPLIIPIEFISYIFRVVSLSVRLFANMMAGHTLLAVLAGFGWTMANGTIELLVLHPFPILVVFVLVFLETAVAIIQAYVFTILTCMYLDEAINLH